MNISGDSLLYAVALSLPFFLICLACYFKKKHSPHIGPFWKITIANILIFLILLSTLFLAFESYYRFIYDQSDSFGVTRVSGRWFNRYYHYNNLDLRDNIDYIKKKGGQARFTFLGDSFTAGHGIKNIEDRFANIIRKSKNKEWEIQVFAKNGLETGGELKTLKKAVNLGYEIDNVVLIYCLNDISDLVPNWNKTLHGMYQKAKKQGFLLKHSFFINTIYYRLRIGSNPKFSNYYNFVSEVYSSTLWNFQKDRIEIINNYVKDRGGVFHVIIFPFLHSFKTGYPYNNIHNKLSGFFQEKNIPYLDLLDIFEKYSSHNLTVNKFDAHPNEFAHSLAAKDILNFLEHKHSHSIEQ